MGLHPSPAVWAVILREVQVDDLYIVVRGNIKHVRELQQGKEKVNEAADFWKNDSSDPFRKQQRASSNYDHIKSPVALYCKDASSRSRTRTRAQRKALLASGLAKVRLIPRAPWIHTGCMQGIQHTVFILSKCSVWLLHLVTETTSPDA